MAESLTIETATALFATVIEEDAMEDLLAVDEILDTPVQAFPGGGRPSDLPHRIESLSLLRNVVGSLSLRPDLDIHLKVRRHDPPDPDEVDYDLLVDVLLQPGELDLGGPDAVATGRLGLHVNGLNGTDMDPSYTHQGILVVTEASGGLRPIGTRLSCPMHCDLPHLPGTDIRDDVEALKSRVMRTLVRKRLEEMLEA